MTEPFDAIEATRELLAEVRTAHLDLRRQLTVAQARIAELEATIAWHTAAAVSARVKPWMSLDSHLADGTPCREGLHGCPCDIEKSDEAQIMVHSDFERESAKGGPDAYWEYVHERNAPYRKCPR